MYGPHRRSLPKESQPCNPSSLTQGEMISTGFGSLPLWYFYFSIPACGSIPGDGMWKITKPAQALTIGWSGCISGACHCCYSFPEQAPIWPLANEHHGNLLVSGSSDFLFLYYSECSLLSPRRFIMNTLNHTIAIGSFTRRSSNSNHIRQEALVGTTCGLCSTSCFIPCCHCLCWFICGLHRQHGSKKKYSNTFQVQPVSFSGLLSSF